MSGYPPSYFRALADVEERHWWHRGMLAITRAVLRERIARGGALLDAGCGTGGFLAWAETQGFTPLAGVDLSTEAVATARGRVPTADLHVASVGELPFADGSFDLVCCNDVLQHVEEALVAASLRELRRVLRPGGALLLRTNGGLRPRRERADWRVYDRRSLRAELEAAGFRCERLSFVNTIGSLAALVRGHVPHAPTDARHGIPALPRRGGGVRYGLLRAEAAWLSLPRVTLPYGHTMVALAVRGPD